MKEYVTPKILEHHAGRFETQVSGCDDNGLGDDKHNHDNDHGQGSCHTHHPHE